MYKSKYHYHFSELHGLPAASVNVSTEFNEIMKTYDKRIRPSSLNGNTS